MRKKMHHGAIAIIFENAKRLRNNLTPSERIFWKKLKASFPLIRFRRQHPIAEYVADFYCHKLKLVIEIDGSIHELDSVIENDKKKEAYFISIGLKVFRFTNEDIKHRADSCIEEIRKFANCTSEQF